jgi:hypothetical protein
LILVWTLLAIPFVLTVVGGWIAIATWPTIQRRTGRLRAGREDEARTYANDPDAFIQRMIRDLMAISLFGGLAGLGIGFLSLFLLVVLVAMTPAHLPAELIIVGMIVTGLAVARSVAVFFRTLVLYGRVHRLREQSQGTEQPTRASSQPAPRSETRRTRRGT